MATYSDLQTRIKRNLIDTPTSVQLEVPLLINEALKTLQGKHNFQVQKATHNVTTAQSGIVLGAVPEDWKEFRGRPYFLSEQGARQTLLTVAANTQDMFAYRGNNLDKGSPRYITIDFPDTGGQSVFIIMPTSNQLSDYPDGEYRITIPYWRYLPALSGDLDQNWFTINETAVSYIVKRCVADGFYMNEDEQRAQTWEGRAKDAYKDLLLIDKYSVLSGFDTWVPHDGALAPRLNN